MVFKVSSWNTQLKAVELRHSTHSREVTEESLHLDKYYFSLFKQAAKKPPLKDTGLFGGDTASFFLSDWQLGKTIMV